MQAPAFWHRDPSSTNWQRTLLTPLGALYAGATRRRVAKAASGYKAQVPVICVGNLNAGGAGKTPTTLALAQILSEAGARVVIVSRGYGGRVEGPVWVKEGEHTAEDVGDEPVLMAAFAPVVVGRDRAKAVRMAEVQADVIVMDDGHQNPSVRKDLSIVVVDASIGFGNGAVIPAGPLREPVSVGLSRCDALLSIGGSAAQERFRQRWSHAVGVPHLTAQLEPLQTGMSWEGLRVVAFAGIAHPDRFFQTMEALGADVVAKVPLGDHQRFSPQLLSRLQAEAKAKSAQLVTTEKDASRLPPVFRRQVLTLPVRLKFDDPAALRKIVNPILKWR